VLTFQLFLLSESITKPYWYTREALRTIASTRKTSRQPVFICPLTIPDQAGYVRCRSFTALGWFNV